MRPSSMSCQHAPLSSENYGFTDMVANRQELVPEKLGKGGGEAALDL